MLYETNTLAHHGVLGMKWGVRRYQRKDGTLTREGRMHYGSNKDFAASKIAEEQKGKVDLSNRVKSLSDIGDHIVSLTNEIDKVSTEEAKAALKNPNFKKDVEKNLHDLFGNGVDDAEFFYMEQSDVIDQLLSDYKYAPKTSDLFDQLDNSFDSWNTEAKKITDSIVSEAGDKPLIKIDKQQAVMYSDVVERLVNDQAGGGVIGYLGRHRYELPMMSDNYPDTTNVKLISVDEYNKKYQS